LDLKNMYVSAAVAQYCWLSIVSCNCHQPFLQHRTWWCSMWITLLGT
jgi:hypothetical protein